MTKPIDTSKIETLEKTTDENLILVQPPAELESFSKPEPEQPQKPEKQKKPKRFTPPPVQPILGDNDLFSKEPEKQPEQSQTTTKVTLDTLVSGSVLVNTFDKIMSVIVPLGINKFTDFKIKPSDVAATKDEKKVLEPVVTECAKTLPIDFSNPWVALVFCVFGIYGGKVAEKINFSDDIFGEDKKTSGRNPIDVLGERPPRENRAAYDKWYRDKKKLGL